jgi:hypothetical protein
MLHAVMLDGIMLNVIMLNVIMLNVAASFKAINLPLIYSMAHWLLVLSQKML